MGLDFDSRQELQHYHLIAGIDEAGRGPWAGPVVASAVILPEGYRNPAINDSKKLSAKQRDVLFDIIHRDALAIGVGLVSASEIDRVNILQATKIAMRQALNQLSIKPELVLIDAVTLPDLDVEQIALIHGDQLSLSIAAASIIAKVTRDRLLIEAYNQYPMFRFDIHKGYGTKLHQQELNDHGPLLNFHRFSYKPIQAIIKKNNG